MGVRVYWSSLHLFEPQTVIHIDFYDGWSWSDYEYAEIKIRHMCISRSPEPMNLVAHFHTRKERPELLLMLANAFQRMDIGVAMVVGADAAMYAFEPIVQRIYPMQYQKIRPASSLDIAYQQLAQLRDDIQWAIA